MSGCIFCKIVKKELPAKVEYEDEDILVFHDIHPAADLHLLVAPKEHFAGIEGLGVEQGELLGKIYRIINKFVLEKGLKNDYYRVVVNGGKSQIVPHLHFHLLGGKWKKFV